jgi:hypothetical protein
VFVKYATVQWKKYKRYITRRSADNNSQTGNDTIGGMGLYESSDEEEDDSKADASLQDLTDRKSSPFLVSSSVNTSN